MMRISKTRPNNRLVKVIEEYDLNRTDYSSMWGTDKNNPHTYCDFYEDLFEQYLDKEINILEIGSEFGSSAVLFNKYLPKANIVSIDINPLIVDSRSKNMVNSKVSFHTLDAFTQEGLNFCKSLHPDGYDVIIDDGPHTLESQIFTAQYYTQLLKQNGSVVIEDIFEIFWINIISGYIPKELKYEPIILNKLKYRYDDIIMHIRK